MKITEISKKYWLEFFIGQKSTMYPFYNANIIQYNNNDPINLKTFTNKKIALIKYNYNKISNHESFYIYQSGFFPIHDEHLPLYIKEFLSIFKAIIILLTILIIFNSIHKKLSKGDRLKISASPFKLEYFTSKENNIEAKAVKETGRQEFLKSIKKSKKLFFIGVVHNNLHKYLSEGAPYAEEIVISYENKKYYNVWCYKETTFNEEIKKSIENIKNLTKNRNLFPKLKKISFEERNPDFFSLFHGSIFYLHDGTTEVYHVTHVCNPTDKIKHQADKFKHLGFSMCKFSYPKSNTTREDSYDLHKRHLNSALINSKKL